MAHWTHVCGCVRYDDIPELIFLRPKYEAALSNDIPSGLNWDLWEDPGNTLAKYVVRIWGSLKNFYELQQLRDWFSNCVLPSDFLVRQAILTVAPEGGDAIVYMLPALEKKVLVQFSYSIHSGEES